MPMNYRFVAVMGLWMVVGAAGQVALGAENDTRAPCQSQPGFGDFDFWIGNWQVSLVSGETAGENQIVREQNGCVLVERWKGARGSTGISLNYYDAGDDRWVQNWVGSGGTVINIRGGLVDGSMRLEGTIQYLGQGHTNAFRGTWTLLEDGRVRQFFEESKNNGETWEPWFEGLYARKDPKSPLGG